VPDVHTILVVDDNAPALEATVRILQKAGYAVARAADGSAALAQVRALRPNLVLLDVVLPDVSGPEVLRQIRADPALNRVRVVLLSAQQFMPEHQAGGLDAGADDYIVRPVGNVELLARVRAYLRQDELIEQLRASEEQFSSAFAYAAVGMALVAPDGRYLKVNRAFCEMLGYAEAEFRALTFQEITFAGDRGDQGQVQRLLAGEIASFQMEKRYRHRQGHWVTGLLSVSLVRDAAGRPVHQIAQIQDITARKGHEIEIERLTRLYAALSQINQAIVWTPSRDELFEKICRVLVEHGGFLMAWIGWHDFDQSRLLPVAAFGDENGYLRGIQIYTDDRPEARGPTGTAFREGRPYVCNDFLNDPATQPWRAEAQRRGFRASAAFPIRERKVTKGTITVYADEAGIFRDKEIALLEEAAVDVSFGLDNLQREAARQRAEEANVRALRRLTEAQRIGQIGDWELDLGTGEITWSPQTFAILGRDPSLGPPRSDEETAALYDPASAALMAEKIATAIASGEPQEYELVALRPDGQRVSVQSRASPRKDEAGKVVGLHGTVQDITARKAAEVATARLAAIVTSSDDAIIGKDLNGIVTNWNAAAEKLFGYSAQEMMGQPILRLIPPERQLEEAEILGRVRRGEGVRHFETVRRRKDGSLIDVSITTSAIKDAAGRIFGVSKIVRDITVQKAHEREIVRMNRLYAALSQVNHAIVTTRDRDELFTTICRGLVEYGGFSLAWIGWVEPETRRVIPVGQWGDKEGYLTRIEIFADDRLEGCGPTGAAIREAKYSVSNDFSRDPSTRPWREMAERARIRASAAFPIRENGAVCGAMTVYSGEAGLFQDKEIALLNEAAGDISFGIENLNRKAARQQAEVELRAAERQLHSLIGRLHTVREQEAKRIARELHDDLGQKLTVLNMELAELERKLPGATTIQLRQIDRMREVVDRTIEVVQKISGELRLGQLDMLGLTAAIDWQLKEFAGQAGIACRIARLDEAPHLSDVQRTTVFRIMQEALTNIARHAGATEVVVSLQAGPDELTLTVRDNGRGISAAELSDRKSIGLLGMRERALIVGGEVTITGGAGAGTTVMVRIPLNGPAALSP
jgi:PAS domain S-box-containing protein